MKQSKQTKQAFLMSILAMLLCVTMLVGTTMAWFTDSVTTGVNKIVAGNLDVELEYAKEFNDAGNPTVWEPVTADTKLFNNKEADGKTNNLWEPGHTEVVYLRIRNAGTLALKYNFTVTGDDTKIGTSVNGNDIYLSKYLVFGQKQSKTAITKFESREAAWAAAGETMGLQSFTKENTKLLPKAEEYVALVVYMPTTVGNEANYARGSRSPEITLGITLAATQTPHEVDSFNDQYDKDLDYPAVSDAALAEKLANAQPGDTVTVAPGTYELPAAIPEGVTISGEGADNTILEVPATPDINNKKTGLVIDQPGVTIRDAQIKRASFLTSDEYCGFIDIREGGTTLDGIKIDRTYVNTSAVVIKNGVGEGETVRIANSNLSGDFKTIDIVDGVNGTIEIDNSEIGGIYTFNVNSASSQNLVINVTNSKLHGWTSYGDIKSASFTNTEFSMGESGQDYLKPYADTTLTNCTFDEAFRIGAGAKDKTYTFNNCTFNGTPLTAENVHTVLDLDDSDELANLKTCKIIVDGVTVTIP